MNMSDCHYSEKLSDFLDGHLEPDTEQALRRHLLDPVACDCPRTLEELRSLVRALRDLPPGTVPEGGWERLEATLEGTPVVVTAPRSVLAWAASLVLVAALLAWALQQPGADLFPVTQPTVGGTLQEVRATSWLRDPQVRPRVLAAVNREQLPPLRFRDEDLVRYGVELASLDSLIEVARSFPAAAEDPDFQKDLDGLTSLREDLLTEMVLQAQAERTATWQ